MTAFLLSAPGPIVTGISALLSYSTTQIADFLRRSTELLAIFISWWIFRKLRHNKDLDGTKQARLEHLANLYVGIAMGCSGVMLLIISISRMSKYSSNGNVTMGLVIALLGLLTNTWFWFRYRTLTREHYNAIIAIQQRLYQAKAFVDLCVVTALSAIAIAPAHAVTRFVDILGSIIVACYLIWNGFSTIRKVSSLTVNENA